MAVAENLDELLADLHDYGTQTAYGVICDAPGFADRWGFMDDSLKDAKRRAAELIEQYGVPFRAVTMKISVEIQVS